MNEVIQVQVVGALEPDKGEGRPVKVGFLGQGEASLDCGQILLNIWEQVRMEND